LGGFDQVVYIIGIASTAFWATNSFKK